MISAVRCHLWPACLAWLALASVVGACSPFDQGEGEVCDVNAPNGGSDDCQNGLSCQEAQGARTSPNPYRCCPGDLNLATTAVCMLATAVVDASSAPPVEVADGAEEGGIETDSAADASPDVAQSISSEASVEAAATDSAAE